VLVFISSQHETFTDEVHESQKVWQTLCEEYSTRQVSL
jgi:hypothetical protein